MKILIVASQQDAAGMNIVEHLKPTFSSTTKKFDTPIFESRLGKVKAYLTIIHTPTVSSENLDEKFEKITGKLDAIIFATKHDSVSGIPSFCVHTQGNWSSADLGGNSGEVAICPVVLRSALYVELIKQNTVKYDAVNEVTHHGPSLQTPSVFIEIGSSKNEWSIPQNGQIIANTILTVLKSYKGEQNSGIPTVLGLGGPHTCTNFNKLTADKAILLGHVCPSYKIEELTADTLKHAIARHTQKPIVALDWKSFKSANRQRIITMLEAIGQKWVRSKDLGVVKKSEDL